MRTAASAGQAQRRGISAVGIDRVVAARVDASEAGLRDLVAGVVADVDDRLEEDRAAQRVDRDASRAQAVLQRVRALGDVGARLAARDDVVLADAVEDPAGVGDQLVVRQRQQRTAPQRRSSRAGSPARARVPCGSPRGRRGSCAGSRGSASWPPRRRRRGRAPRRPPSTPGAASSPARASPSPRSRPRRTAAARPPRPSGSGRSPRRPTAPSATNTKHQQHERRQRHEHASRREPDRQRQADRARRGPPAACRCAPRRSTPRRPRSRGPGCVRVPGPGRRWS